MISFLCKASLLYHRIRQMKHFSRRIFIEIDTVLPDMLHLSQKKAAEFCAAFGKNGAIKKETDILFEEEERYV